MGKFDRDGSYARWQGAPMAHPDARLKEPLPDGADAGLRIDGQIVFTDTMADHDAELAAELEYDRAGHAVYTVLCEAVAYIDRREVRERAADAIDRYDRARANFPYGTATGKER